MTLKSKEFIFRNLLPRLILRTDVGIHKLWWLNVTATPEIKSMNVFNNGMCSGFKILIPTGGQTDPRSTLGEMLAWKKAQKKAKKNIISETIKRITPILSPRRTIEVWYPNLVDSRITSLHQTNMIDKIINSPRYINDNPLYI
jgi:hypothetical protein